MAKDIIAKYGQRVGYTKSQIDAFQEGGHQFMRYVKCLDAGVDCLGFGEVMMKVRVIPRVKKEEGLSS